jgi:Fic family protein
MEEKQAVSASHIEDKPKGVIRYAIPAQLIRYDAQALAPALADAKAAVLSLQTIPYQRSWVEELQNLELKREVAGTSRIEGAEFTERELDAALRENAGQLQTRSQRQARAAIQTYRWIARIPQDMPLTEDLIKDVHRRIVTGADDDHCAPGRLRGEGENVTFGAPRHRGAEGGEECNQAFSRLVLAIRDEFQDHDPMIQALAVHYHVAAIHPFNDGNGRTARAIEALMLQRAGLKDSCFIAMSNYYYEEKTAYLSSLAAVREQNFDLTPFLLLGLRGISVQSRKLLSEIRHQVAKGLFRNLMFDLFDRLKSPKKRVLAKRQTKLLSVLLDVEHIDLEELISRTDRAYEKLKNPRKAMIRDLNDLIGIGAIGASKRAEGGYTISIRLEWPTEITETKFFAQLKALPRSKTMSFFR